MTLLVQRDDNGKDMLVEYDSGCGCCAGYRAINATEEDTFYDVKYLDQGKVAEALREQIAIHQDSLRALQQYALDHNVNIMRWGLSPDMTPLEQQNMAEDMPRNHFIDALTPYDGDLG